MKTPFSLALIAVVSSGLNLFGEEPRDQQLTELTNKVSALEERIGKLEQTLSSMTKEAGKAPDLTGIRERARKRFAQDQSTYSQAELAEIEQLYQVANKERNSPEARQSLKTLIEKYPKSNRTGCAVQYLGQMASDGEKEQLLKQAIKDYSDCYYGDGVQVGAYARFYLAGYYKTNGRTEEASALYQEILRDYPDAVDHKGRPLKEYIPR